MEDKEFKEAVAGVMKDKNQREALAQLIIEYIQPNHLSGEIIGALLPTRAMSLGDQLVKRVRRGIEVRTWVPGSMSLKSEVTLTDRINWNLDSAIVSVMANEWELAAGEIGTIADMKREASLKLRDYYFTKMFTALSTIWNSVNTPLNYTDCGGNITQVALENMIQRINNTTPGAKAIVGVRSALTPLTKFAPFYPGSVANTVPSQTMLDEVLRTGWIGQYMGVPVVAVNQLYDNLEDYNAMLPTDRILIVGETVGEFITYGPERSKEYVDNVPTPPYWNLDIIQQFGMIIDNVNGIGVLKVTAS
jgi:hypothetical protein